MSPPSSRASLNHPDTGHPLVRPPRYLRECLVRTMSHLNPGPRGPTGGSATTRGIEAAGLPKIVPHALRHRVAWDLIDRGFTVDQVADWIGDTPRWSRSYTQTIRRSSQNLRSQPTSGSCTPNRTGGVMLQGLPTSSITRSSDELLTLNELSEESPPSLAQLRR